MGGARTVRLVGRERELSQLRQAAEESRGGDARIVVVEGEPGIGKTHLVSHLVTELRQAGDLVVCGHGVNFASEELSYGVAAELLRNLVHQVGPDQVRAAVGAHAANLAALHPAFAAGVEPVSQTDRAGLFGAMHTALLELTRDRMLCLLVDDLQWVDASSRALVDYLAKVSMYTPLLLVCTVRSTPSEQAGVAADLVELSRIPGSQTLRLDPLSAEAVAEFVHSALGGHVRPDVLSRVQRVSEGVPLYVEELLAAGEQMTTTLRVNLAARLDGLDADTLRFLEAAAVAAGHADEELVAQVARVDHDTAVRARELATSHGLLAASSDGEVRFYHALLRDATLLGVDSDELADFHRRWAVLLEETPHVRAWPDVRAILAQHWCACGDHDRALVAAVAAARSAAGRGGLAEAALWWERALALWEKASEPERLTGLVRNTILDKTLTGLHFQLTDAAFRHIIDLCHQELVRDEDDWVKTLCLRLLMARARIVVEGAAPSVVPASEFPATAEALLAEPNHELVNLCLIHLAGLNPAALSPDVLERVLERIVTDAEGSDALPAVLGWQGAVLLDQGQDARALEATQRLAVLCRDEHVLVSPIDLRSAVVNFHLLGHYAEAVQLFNFVVGVELGPATVLLWSGAVVAIVDTLFATGDWPRCLSLLGALEATGPGPVLVGLLHTLSGRIAALRGETELAHEHLRVVRANIPEPGAPGAALHLTGAAALAMAQLRCIAGTADEELFGMLIRTLEANDLTPAADLAAEILILEARCLAVNHAHGSEWPARLREIKRALPQYGRFGAAWSAELDALLDGLEGHPSESSRWKQVVHAWDDTGHAFYAAQARSSLAEALLREGDRRTASEVLDQALAVAEALGAEPLAQRLRGLGRSARLHGSAAETLPAELGRLTARETEVLALVARGKTNHQIAADLFMSPKTASVHVSHIIAKLGVGNRTEAANFAHRHGLADYNPA